MNFLNINFTSNLLDLTYFSNQFTNEMDIYLIMIIALGLLAIGDLIVGVSNDAVNFLNSALSLEPFGSIFMWFKSSSFFICFNSLMLISLIVRVLHGRFGIGLLSKREFSV